MQNGIGTSGNSRAFVTTSWDDGPPLDIRLAALLAKYGVVGTFYVPTQNKFPVMAPEEIRALRSMGMEIGSHTMTHPKLTRLRKSDAIKELVGSKCHLEDIVDDAIVSFCYPAGQVNAVTRSWVVEAGYSLARTTVAFSIDSDFDPFRMPVSFQFLPHSRLTYTRRALRERNIDGLMNWATLWELESNPVRLLELQLEYIVRHGGLLHIWGHSWEIEQRHLWAQLEDALRCLANVPQVIYLTNSQTLTLIPKHDPFVARDINHAGDEPMPRVIR